MFGMLMHPTLELSIVLVVISTLFIASSAIIVQAGKDGKCSKIEKDGTNFKYGVAVLVVACLVLVYGLGFLGLHLYDRYM